MKKLDSFNDDIVRFGVGWPEMEYKRRSISLWSVYKFFIRVIEILFVLLIVSIIVIIVFDL
jgi:hypothetical protein